MIEQIESNRGIANGSASTDVSKLLSLKTSRFIATDNTSIDSAQIQVWWPPDTSQWMDILFDAMGLNDQENTLLVMLHLW